MHVENLPLQPVFKQKMHGWRGSGFLQPAAGDVMVRCQDLGNASYALVNIYVFFFFSEFWPTDRITQSLVIRLSKGILVRDLPGATWIESQQQICL